MKNKDYTNLKDKTIFDFCTDEELIKNGFGHVVEDKEEFIRFMKENPSSNALMLLQLAVEVLHDDKLIEAIERDFSDVTIPRYE
ncbi:hypothetical protein PORUE0001_0498 [Porphyromonas uenonis 60-3]|uniref:Uncharacterized protein n=1 Tax=Porphyromonas uenonis 60-3 TaxID=596327 RepID=C2MBS6_9PORP|nr:hypothetical protein [Porphyromonas uenonis]EEK16830.1 hypothetical protein PORUE0001_0498 [Porphyromonas uenonis 60-3]